MKDILSFEEKQKSSQLIFDGKVLHLYRDEVYLPNGKEGFREFCRHNGAVCIVPITDEGEVVCVNQYRYAVDRMMLEIPAGKLDAPDEDPESAAIRELKEETGVDVKVIQGFRREIEYKLHRIPDTIKQSVYFLGECTSDKIICQEAEVAEAGFIPYEDALKILTFEETKSILKDAEAIIKLSES